MSAIHRTGLIPPDIRSAADYRSHARARLDPVAWNYLESGAGEGLSMAANARAFADYPLMPRMLADVRGGHTRLALFGESLEHPLLLAPIAYQCLFHPDGEAASLTAADAQGGIAIVSSLASQPFAEIVGGATRRHWFQLYWQGSRERTARLLDRAHQAGFAALVFTLDAPIKQAAMQLPPKVRAVNLDAPLAMPPIGAGQSPVFDGWMSQAPTWDDLAWLRSRTPLPLLAKGILHPADAARAADLGCDGVIVSNHGGRVLDGAPASLAALPAVRDALCGNIPILLDSGIRSGSDAAKALAAGATAVLVGRPYVWGLATAGALGVAHVLRLLRDELEMIMALCGWREVGGRRKDEG